MKLLRALQEGEIEPVGARRSVPVDVRVISATNRNLLADVKSGRFREDLFYRLHVFPVSVPPLRQRPEDIPDLIRHFLARFCAEEGKTIKAVSGDAIALLQNLRWPGNVRQLENAMFRAVVLADGDEIGLDEFPQLSGHDTVIGNDGSSASLVPDHGIQNPAAEDLVIDALPPFNPDHLALLQGDHLRPLDELGSGYHPLCHRPLPWADVEVARRLRIGRSTLYRKLEGLGLSDPEKPKSPDPVAAE